MRFLRSLLDGQSRLRRKESESEDNLWILGPGSEPSCSALYQEGSREGQSMIPAHPCGPPWGDNPVGEDPCQPSDCPPCSDARLKCTASPSCRHSTQPLPDTLSPWAPVPSLRCCSRACIAAQTARGPTGDVTYSYL